jgi:hypothetical protein
VKQTPGKPCTGVNFSQGVSDLAAITSVNNAGSWDWSEREVRHHLVFMDPCRQRGPLIGSEQRLISSSIAAARGRFPISSACWPENLAMDKLFWR